MALQGDRPENPVIYQIYPRSFRDTSGTGEGDLRGVVEGLDHVASLGVDAIWLSPFFRSPMCDGGYDVADHCAVDPRFGTMQDFDDLLDRAHALGLRVMVDLVLNHTSDTHDWFARSLAREEGYEDVYVWADPKPDGSPPSNWVSFFGHPAWRWHPQRRQYCLTKFLPCQPCLNHYDTRVGQRLGEITRFWLDRGVDGFRYDAVTSFFHDRAFRDNPAATDAQAALIPGPSSNPFTYQSHRHDVMPKDCAAFCTRLREMAGPAAFLLGEVNNGPRSIEVLRDVTADGRLDAAYTVDLPERGPTQEVLADVLTRLDGDGGLAWWLSCHDQPRHVSAHGDGTARDAKLFATLLCALPGPLLMFQGEELGQPQAKLGLDDLHDPYDRMYWPQPMGRDGARAPMAWDATLPRCGFSGNRPWLPIHPPEDGGAAQQAENPGSVLSFYKQALALRRAHALSGGRMSLLDAPDGTIRARIETGDARLLLAVNLRDSDWTPEVAPTAPCASILQSAPPGPGGALAPRSAAWWLEPADGRTG
ncbi:Maltodextrin glucosidase [Roseibacterium elongatum DSM 19469]|uniref:Maltodextrin glucosidase n=1 Tax=Roseicyclus elongatus DSM 19469 TaxID=1294273 RepID=W8RV12_9RHOB|nr:alpha-amylase family glycosyl hydrolase [Roseibacterium elongatum]AHM05098.1 Maltodextrin glucosidase [Roseibacterium elongatum DSM 19469]